MTVLVGTAQTAIENGFPFEKLAAVAELESWRKEVNRPIYHIHKWWAQRLGSVFRAMLIAATYPKDADIMSLFCQKLSLDGIIVFDPFMGSGTTIGEAYKLGARAIGKDINPVAVFAVQNALGEYSREEVQRTFCTIEKDLAENLRSFYVALLPDGTKCEALYYFWVKTIQCPVCHQSVDLFTSRVFSTHAYPAKFPEAKAVCPACGAVNSVRYDSHFAACQQCGRSYDPHVGNAKDGKATCPMCHSAFPIAKTYLKTDRPPTHRLYAKMVLTSEGEKVYLPADHFDIDLYENAKSANAKRGQQYPLERIEPGYNTDQVLNYGYRHWHEMFNDRQLLCLSLLSERIAAIPETNMRDLFACLFSGMLEFNNMFASFKGEGTGAVRHMFSHHILKPELMPLEANMWGTDKSSGAFSTLFKTRLLKALDYRENPFEVQAKRVRGKTVGEKVFGASKSIGGRIASTWAEFQATGAPLLIGCGDSSHTDIDKETVDLIVTDPPFFDNVHYSQLADFFYVWLRQILGTSGMFARATTRVKEEVQQSNPQEFTINLTAVFKECFRVLKESGLLIFTYHHSRIDGWVSVFQAVTDAGFIMTCAHPTKAEMAVAQPKRQAKEPINFDIIFVCKKRHARSHLIGGASTLLLETAREVAKQQIRLFNIAGYRLSRNDVLVMLMGQVLVAASCTVNDRNTLRTLETSGTDITHAVEELWRLQDYVSADRLEEAPSSRSVAV